MGLIDWFRQRRSAARSAGPASTAYRVEYVGREGSYPKSYRYAVWRGTQRIAELGHDFRNDSRWVIFDGPPMDWGDTMLVGGGPQPLEISKELARFFDERL